MKSFDVGFIDLIDAFEKLKPNTYEERLEIAERLGLSHLIKKGIKRRGKERWYFSGTPNGWKRSLMSSEGNSWETTVNFEENGRFIITNGSQSYPDDDYLVEASGTYRVIFNSRSKNIDLKTKDEEQKWYFSGNPNSWGKSTMLSKKGDNWELAVEFRENDRFKITNGSEFYPESDYVIGEAGTYKVIFNCKSGKVEVEPEEETQEWYFCGTTNDWTKSPMFHKDFNTWEILVNFVENDRFRVTNGAQFYPEDDYRVEEDDYYIITFNALTKEVKAELKSKTDIEKIGQGQLLSSREFTGNDYFTEKPFKYVVPPFLSIVDKSKRRAKVISAGTDLVDTGEVDIEGAIDILTQNMPLTTFPYLREKCLSHSFHILLDKSERMRPYIRDEFDWLVQFEDIVGKEYLEVYSFLGSPRREILSKKRDSIAGYKLPSQGMPIIVFSDLAINSRDTALRGEWLDFFREADSKGCPITVFSPYSSGCYPEKIKRYLTIMEWAKNGEDRHKIDEVMENIREFKEETLKELYDYNKGALLLAMLTSLAVRVEPELLRKLRLRFAPFVNLGAEGALWFSSIVERRSSLAILYKDEVVRELRILFKERTSFDMNEVFREINSFRHKTEAQKFLRLEEGLVLAAMSNKVSQATYDNLNHKVFRTLASASNNELNFTAQDVAGWACKVLPQLPDHGRDTTVKEKVLKASRLISHNSLNRVQSDGKLNENYEIDEDVEALFNSYDRIKLEVILTDRALYLKYPADEGRETYIEVPDMNPVILSLISKEYIKQLFLAPGRVNVVPWKRNSIVIVPLDGSMHKVNNRYDLQIIQELEELGISLTENSAEEEFDYYDRGYLLDENEKVIAICIYEAPQVDYFPLLTKLTSLRRLNLRVSELEELPDSIGRLEELEELRLGGNRLSWLPETIGELKKLKLLELNHNPLSQLPESLSRLESLEELELGATNLTVLPDSLCELANLKRLVLPEEQIDSLSENLAAFVDKNGVSFNGTEESDLDILRQLEAELNLPILSSTESEKSIYTVDKNERVTYLDLSNRGLSYFPETICKLRGLKNLLIGVNGIEVLPESIGRLRKLEQLYLGYNRLKTLPESFDKLTRLEDLELSGNPLGNFPEQLIKLTNLKHLYFSKSKLSFLPNSIDELVQLEHLYLDNNRLSVLPKTIPKLSGLLKLDLRGNRFLELPETLLRFNMEIYFKPVFEDGVNLYRNPISTPPVDVIMEGREAIRDYLNEKKPTDFDIIKQLEEELGIEFQFFLDSGENGERNYIKNGFIHDNKDNIIVLYVRGIELKTIPDLVCKLTNLRELYLGNNKLEELPGSLRELCRLEKLDLNNNVIQILPDFIADIGWLKSLDLYNNQLSTLPPSFVELKRLQSLNLSFNQFNTLPDLICELDRLETLYMNNNELITLPDKIGSLKGLKDLNVYSNQLIELPDSIGSLVEMKYLHLGFNKLFTLPDSIGYLIKLEKLNLESNKLITIPASIGKLISLKTLYVNNNQLTALPDSIGKLSKLRSLSLDNNRLSTLPDNIGELSELKRLNLSSNELLSLPNSIGEIEGLKRLELTDNQLTTLPDSISRLKGLSTLDLIRNNISLFPQVLLKLDMEIYWDTGFYTGINLSQNPFVEPPVDVIKQGRESIADYFKEREPTDLDIIKQLEKELGIELPELSYGENDEKIYYEKNGFVCDKQGNVLMLLLSNINLTFMPDSITKLERLKMLNLAGNQLTHIPDTIGKLTRLESLDLGNNNILTLPMILGELTELRRLDLEDNQLNIISDGIGNLVKLVRLDLGGNQLTVLPDTISGLIQLKTFDIRYNQLKILPDTVGELIELKSLNLSHNQLTTLPDTIGNLIKLKTLYVNNNQLTTIPYNFGRLRELQSVYLNHNQIKIIPDIFQRLGNLVDLHLGANNLFSLPDTIKDLVKVKTLELGDNNFKVIPNQIIKLVNLEYLNLSNNELSTLPFNFDRLKKLEKLDLSRNKFDTIPKVLLNLDKDFYWGSTLNKGISFYGNPIKTPPLDVIKNGREAIVNYFNKEELNDLYVIKQLEEVFEIKLPKLSDIDKNGFSNYKRNGYISNENDKVTVLVLNDLNIESLPETVCKLNKLKHLDIHGNQLSFLPPSFNELKEIEELDLSHNLFSSFPGEINSLKSLRELYLNSNQLTFIPQFINWFEELEILNCDYNQFTTLPETVGLLRGLKKLYFDGNKIVEIPSFVGSLSNLEELSIRTNSIKIISSEIGRLKELKELYLENNMITVLPDSLGNLKELKSLYINQNELTNLPDSIGYLNSLQYLDLKYNRLSSLPETIGNLTELELLDLMGNRLSTLPYSIGYLRNLRDLNLTSNMISFLPDSLFRLNMDIYLTESRGAGKGILLDTKFLKSPPIKVIKKGRQAVIDYFEREREMLGGDTRWYDDELK